MYVLPVRILLIAAVLLSAGPQSPSFEQRYTAPIDLFKTGLGTFTKKISTSNAEAQAFFDQGFQMMYSFAKPEAVRSFRESWKRDDNCAICYWGEAWAWGSYLNGADDGRGVAACLRRRPQGESTS